MPLLMGFYSMASVDQFIQQHKSQFAEKMQDLDFQAEKVNEAIISDSLRFNGRSPVPHARRFVVEERMREALNELKK